MKKLFDIELDERLIKKLPEGYFGDGYCRNCSYSTYYSDRGEYWCNYHGKWVAGNEWHFCG